MRHTEIDFQTIDYSRLSPAQWGQVKSAAMRRGKACRDEAIRAAHAAVMAWTRRLVTGLLARRRKRATVAVLCGLDDRLLKDIGIVRSEIRSRAEFGNRDTTRLPAPATRRAA
jgi:uncharacterized protein YjiS (DUF1127 family)